MNTTRKKSLIFYTLYAFSVPQQVNLRWNCFACCKVWDKLWTCPGVKLDENPQSAQKKKKQQQKKHPTNSVGSLWYQQKHQKSYNQIVFEVIVFCQTAFSGLNIWENWWIYSLDNIATASGGSIRILPLLKIVRNTPGSSWDLLCNIHHWCV